MNLLAAFPISSGRVRTGRGGQLDSRRRSLPAKCAASVRVGFTETDDESDKATIRERSLLQALRKTGSKLVLDSGEVDLLKANSESWKVVDATTNPSLILKAAGGKSSYYTKLAESAIKNAAGGSQQKEGGGASRSHDSMTAAADAYAVALGADILGIVPGRVSTETDARSAYDKDALIEQAKRLIKMYEERGIGRERILIKIAATWEGIEATRVLEKELGIHCNLTLIFSVAQAVACADAGATLVSPFVGRILDWFVARDGRSFSAEEDPGVIAVTSIYDTLKDPQLGLGRTEVMAASFRNIGEVLQLAGCDLLTLSPAILNELSRTPAGDDPLPRRLSPEAATERRSSAGTKDKTKKGAAGGAPAAPGEADAAPQQQHQEQHQQQQQPSSSSSSTGPVVIRTREDFDRHVQGMAREKLTQGVELFAKDAAALEDLLRTVSTRMMDAP